jgi:hypothetical protein
METYTRLCDSQRLNLVFSQTDVEALALAGGNC